MGCRCADIACCQNELNILSGTVEPNVAIVDKSNEQVSQTMRVAGDGVGQAINTDTIHEVEMRLYSLNKEANDLSYSLAVDCSNEIQRVSSLLEQMRSEDHAHHEAEAAAAAAANDGV